jgi:hypothetical protein
MKLKDARYLSAEGQEALRYRVVGSPKQVRMNYSDVQNTRWLQYGYPTF